MGLRAALKIGLVLAAISAVAAISWSFLARSGPAGNSSAELLDPGIARKSTDFEHAEFKLGKTLFRVQSTVDTLSDVGQHELRDVRLTVFGEDGQPTDEITGKTATYALEQKRILFSGTVEARLSDGTRVLSDRLRADLGAETVSIEEDFRFERAEVKGTGRQLLYRTGSKLIEINRDFLLENPGPENPFRATSSRAVYDLAGGRLSLAGEARLSGPGYQLSGNEMGVDLTGERRLQRIESAGSARFVVSPRVFEGERMEFLFEPVSARLRTFTVMGAEVGDRSPALYTESRSGGVHRVLARRITGTPSRSADPQRFQLETLKAEREVRFDSTVFGIKEATAARLDGTFDADGQLRDLRMDGGVKVEHREGERTDHLQSGSLRLQFDEAQRMKKAVAAPNAVLDIVSPDWNRRHSAKDSMVIDFMDGRISQVNSAGGCQIETVEKEGEYRVESATLRAVYVDGVVDAVTAGGGVRVRFKDGAKTQNSDSADLRLQYRQGKLYRATQAGGFRFWERTESGELGLNAGQAVYVPESDVVTVTGPPGRQPELSQGPVGEPEGGPPTRTHADQIQIERASGRVLADGNVATRLEDKARSLRVTAGRMVADPASGWVEYTGSPKVTDGPNFISGKTVRLRDQDQNLIAQGNVESFLSSGVGDRLKQYRVAADEVEIQRAANKAVYKGNVRAKSDEMTLKAPFLELLFSGAGMDELKQATAWGGVEVADQTRTATGERAFFDPQEKRVRVVGDKAQVVDSKQGKATGKALTFFLGDERIEIEGPIHPRP